MTRNRLALLARRFGRLMLAVTVGCGLFAASTSPAWAAKRTNPNANVIPTQQGESYVAAYMIVAASLLLGLTMIGRRSNRTTGEPK
jgi:hypothetical protein